MDPTLEFELFLGEKLGKTLQEIRALPNDEFVAWGIYYGRKAQREQLRSM